MNDDLPLELRWGFGSFQPNTNPPTTGTTPSLPTMPTTDTAATASSAGGADPVTAIANAAGQLFDFGKSILANVNLNKKAWLERLNESVPVFHNWDAERIDKSKDYLYAIGALVVVVVIVLLAITFKNKK